MHDEGEKTVLGVTIPAGGGIEDGDEGAGDRLAASLDGEVCVAETGARFVADNPPDSLVERMAETFTKTDGDLRAVMKTMLDSKEFWSEGAFRSKMKSPLETVASAARR